LANFVTKVRNFLLAPWVFIILNYPTAVIINEHLNEALRRMRRSATDRDTSVDRRLVTNILLSFLTAPRGDGKRFEMLKILSDILSWSDTEREKAGLQRGAGGISRSTSKGSTGDDLDRSDETEVCSRARDHVRRGSQAYSHSRRCGSSSCSHRRMVARAECRLLCHRRRALVARARDHPTHGERHSRGSVCPRRRRRAESLVAGFAYRALVPRLPPRHLAKVRRLRYHHYPRHRLPRGRRGRLSDVRGWRFGMSVEAEIFVFIYCPRTSFVTVYISSQCLNGEHQLLECNQAEQTSKYTCPKY
jgi:hypothetical protein